MSILTPEFNCKASLIDIISAKSGVPIKLAYLYMSGTGCGFGGNCFGGNGFGGFGVDATEA